MSHKRLLVRGVVFSYGALAAQVIYSFASIPLALSHLSAAEFGMFGVITTVASYLMMAELGMTESFIRHLFECKEAEDHARYGRIFTANALSLGAAAFVVLAAGVLVANVAAPLLEIPLELRREFLLVMLGQTFIAALSMVARVIGVPLIINHRQDLLQISQIGQFTVYYVALHLSFRAGYGIYSMIINQAAGLVWIISYYAIASSRRGYFEHLWSRSLPSKEELVDVWNYSLKAFGVQMGTTILTGLPQLLISSFVGLDAAGKWTVCTRVFGILRQLTFKPFAIALPMLLSFFVRGDTALVARRWQHVSQLVMASSGLAFAVAAANNRRFVELWSGLDTGWDTWMHVNIAFFFLCQVIAGLTCGALGFDKKFGFAGFVPILQTLLVVGGALLLAEKTGSGGIIAFASVSYLLGMSIAGMLYFGKITSQSPIKLFLSSIGRPLVVVPLVLVCSLGIAHWAASAPSYFGLFVSIALSCLIGLPLMGYLGVSSEVRSELFAMALKPIRRFRSKSRLLPSEAADP
jgi:O-antigen/teichoic acid export membrane protein